MCQYKCQASKILEFLVSRSLLSSKWSVTLDQLIRQLSDLVRRIQIEAVGVEVKDFLEKQKSSNEDVQFSDLDSMLKMLIDGPDGKSRRWWLFGSFSSPLIQGLLEIRNTYVRKNLEQAEVCRTLRAQVIELRDLQRDLLEKQAVLLDISDRWKANNACIERDKAKFADLQEQYGLPDLTHITREEISSKVLSLLAQTRSEDQSKFNAFLHDPSLQIFLRNYNERFDRHIKLDEDTEESLYEVEELLSYARVTDNGISEILRDIQSRLNRRDDMDVKNIVNDIWNLSQKITNNKTAARLMEAEWKVRQSLTETERRIPELRQIVRETAQLAQESIAKIFPPGIEIVVD